MAENNRVGVACNFPSALYLATPATIHPCLQTLIGHVFGRDVHNPLRQGVNSEAQGALVVLKKKDKHIINLMRVQRRSMMWILVW